MLQHHSIRVSTGLHATIDNERKHTKVDNSTQTPLSIDCKTDFSDISICKKDLLDLELGTVTENFSSQTEALHPEVLLHEGVIAASVHHRMDSPNAMTNQDKSPDFNMVFENDANIVPDTPGKHIICKNKRYKRDSESLHEEFSKLYSSTESVHSEKNELPGALIEYANRYIKVAKLDPKTFDWEKLLLFYKEKGFKYVKMDFEKLIDIVKIAG